MPANKDSEISINGYIYVKQDTLENRKYIPEITLEKYFEEISKDTKLKQYTLPTTYWEVNDPYIKDESRKIQDVSKTLSELIKNDYRYINDRLEYDETKANSDNERIGAKAALMGGGSVCMEYADSMIAILRTQGIPARAALDIRI
jgi:transglutaminase-like putative cysteine protease